MQVYLYPRFFLGLTLVFTFLQASAAPMLNGIGIHKELGQELFMGALYSEALSNDAETLMTSGVPMRMELKILASDGIATRRFSRMWIESMAINSKADFLTAQANNMVTFDSFFKGRIQPGDHIVFASTPGKGVEISLDGVSLGIIKDNQFFTMLLSTWIGKVPLAADFKENLLKMGDIDGRTKERYEQLRASNSRISEIASWTGKALTADTKETAKKETSKPAISSSARSEPERLAKNILKPEIPDLTLPPPSVDKPNLDIPQLTNKPSVTITSSSVTAQQVSSYDSRTATAATVSSQNVQVDEDDDESGPALTAQSLLARQFYVSDALKKVTGKIKYPQRALDRDQEGSVRIGVIIDRQGNLLSMSRVEESKYSLLTKEAEDAIKRTAPFPKLPDAIPGTKFQFSIPVRFTLPKE